MLIVLLLFFLNRTSSAAAPPRVRISNGEIEGRELSANYSLFGKQTGLIFLGIPHLEPPIGELRFRKPVRNEKTWQGILETKEMKAACMSDPIETYKRPEGGPTSEDCLYINVYTNEHCLEHRNCSVMVAVHGGSMTKESPATFHSDVIVHNFVGQNRNIVVVTVPYRLGVFGLPNMPGYLHGKAERNLILHDVVEGLEWTKREIANFGGDPEKTTLFGHSGGATIGAMISLQPRFDHLYSQRVSQSMPLLMHSEYANSKMFAKVAKNLGCSSEIGKVFDCLRNVSAEKLFETQDHVFHQEEEYFSDFAIDGNMLLDYPRRLLQKGAYSKKPLLIGTVPFELMYNQYLISESGDVRKEDLLKMCELFAFTGDYEKPYGFLEMCMYFYGSKRNAPYLLDHFVFHVPAFFSARHHASEQPVYLYQNTYSGARYAYDKYYEGSVSPVHSEDFIYYMGVHRSKNFTQKDMRIEQILTGIVADFVNFGQPKLSGAQEWEPLNPDLMNYFHIDFDENFEMPGMKDGFYEREFRFWTKTAPEFGGNFTFSTEYSPSVDVFAADIFTEAESTLKTDHWKNDKTVEMARRVSNEIKAFIDKRKEEFDTSHVTTTPSSQTSAVAFSLVLLFFSLLLICN